MRGGWVWTALIATALIARIAWATTSPVIQRDGVVFLSLAREALEGDPATLLRHDQHPLYPTLVALTYPLAGDWEAAGLLISIAAGTLTVIPVVLLGSRVAGAPAGFLGGWIFAAARYPVQYAGSALADSLHGLLFAAAAWAGAKALGIGAEKEEPRGESGFGPPRAFLLSGLLAGLAYLARPEGLLIVVSLSVAAALKLLRQAGGGKWGPFIARGALLFLGLSLTAGPYAAYLTVESGAFTLTRKKPVLETITATAAAPAPAVSRDSTDSPPEAQPVSAFRGRLWGALRSVREFAEGLGWIPAFLFVVGLVHRRRAGGTVLAEVHLLLPVLFLVVLLSGLYVYAGYTGRRHFYPATPLVEGWVGLGLWALGTVLSRLLPRAGGPTRATAVLAVMLVLVMLPKSTGLLEGPARDKDLWTLVAGRALSDTVKPSDGVLPGGRSARVAFYSGGRVLFPSLTLEAEDIERACSEATRLGARWVVLDANPGAPAPPPPAGWSLASSSIQGEREVRLYKGPE